MSRPIFFVLSLLLVTLPAAADDPVPLTDLPADLTREDPAADVDIAVRLVDVRPLPGKAGEEAGGGDVVVLLRRRGGEWTTGHIAAADYNQKSDNTADPSGLTFDGDKLSGVLKVTIGPDSPRPRVTGFPNPADQFAVELDMRLDHERAAPYQPDLEAFMPPWRKDVPTYGGTLAGGTYRGTLATGEKGKEQIISGSATGAVAPAPVPGTWGTTGNISINAAEGGRMNVLARLAPSRVSPPSEAWAVLNFTEPKDLSETGGLRVRVASEDRRDDAAMALAVKVQGGGWHQVTSAAPLLGPEASQSHFDVPWDHFRPRLSFNDRRAIEAIRVGVDNPMGVGDVAFTLQNITALPPILEKPRQPPVVTLQPDTSLSFNATTTIPSGLFGLHQVHSPKLGVSPEGKPDPIEYLTALNPGLLRPLTHTGFGGKRLSDEEVAAKLAEKHPTKDAYLRAAVDAGAVDTVIETYTEDLWNRPSWMNKDRQDFLSGVELFWQNRAATSWTPGDEDNLDRMYEIWNEPFMWGRHINMGFMNEAGQKAWTDDTQYGYLPGTLGAQVIGETLLAAERGAAINPHVQLGAPSAPSIDSNHYGTMQDYIIPFLQTSAGEGDAQQTVGQVLDFFTEHHYGGDPAANAASYEVLTAYMDTKFGRRIPIYNTEANNLGASPAGKARYNIADILHPLNTVPDQLKGRSLHALWSGYLNDEGEEHAYRIMSTLRGTRIASDITGSDALLAAASSPREGELVVLVLNEGRETQSFSLSGVEGFEVAGVMTLIADAPEHELRMRDVDGAMVPQPAAGKTVLKEIDPESMDDPTRFTLPAGSAVRWTLTKEGYVPSKERVRTQHFVDAVLADVEPNKPLEAKVQWRPWLWLNRPGAGGPGGTPAAAIAEERQGAKRAYLRVITRDVHPGEAVAVIGDQEVPLPFSSSNDGAAVVQMIDLDPALIREGDAPIEFRVTDPARFNGYTVYAASVVLER